MKNTALHEAAALGSEGLKAAEVLLRYETPGPPVPAIVLLLVLVLLVLLPLQVLLLNTISPAEVQRC